VQCKQNRSDPIQYSTWYILFFVLLVSNAGLNTGTTVVQVQVENDEIHRISVEKYRNGNELLTDVLNKMEISTTISTVGLVVQIQKC
jgi:hypothetical protein